MTHLKIWTDELKSVCQDRCASSGDPACWEMNGDGPEEAPYDNDPCAVCLRDCGFEVPEEFDEQAAVGRLL